MVKIDASYKGSIWDFGSQSGGSIPPASTNAELTQLV